MWTGLCRAAGLAWLVCAGATHAAAAKVVIEAEALAPRDVRIRDGGDVLIVADPSDGRLEFRGGRALTFVPRGKGSRLTIRVRAPRAGVYRLVVHAVSGPSCGIYDLMHDGQPRGNFNFGTPHTRLHTPVRSHRMLLKRGTNRLDFQYLQQGPRGGCLVLDWLELVPHVPPPRRKPDPLDRAIPPGETHGPELLENGGFELFTPYDRYDKSHRSRKHWQFNSAVPQQAEVVVRDAAQARSGQQAICLKPDPLDDHAILYQTFRAVTGKRYRVSFYARGQGQIRVDFYQYGGKPQHTDSQRTVNTFDLTADWQLYSFVMSPSRSGHVQSMAIALHGVTGGAAWFDDVSVREVLGS